MNKSTRQKLHSNIGHYVLMNAAVIPIETDKVASAEGKSYTFQRAGPDNYVCIHEDDVYVIRVSGDTIGCSYAGFKQCTGNEVCKYLAAFLKLNNLPSAKLSKEVSKVLLSAGWVVGDGGLYPPAPHDPEDSGDVPAPPDTPVAEDSTTHTLPESKPAPPIAEGTSDPDGEDNGGDDPVPEDQPDPAPPEPTPAPAPESAADPIIADIIATAEAAGAKDIDPGWVREKLMDLKQFKVVGTIASQSVLGLIYRDQNITRPKSERGGPNALVTLDSITAPDKWVSLRVKVIALWDTDTESIRQVGLVGDETGTLRFVSWEKAGLELLEKDKCYNIQNVVTNVYEGVFSVALTKNTQIIPLEEDIEVTYTTAEFTGIMVNIQEGSGLIKRCSVCNRAMMHGECKEHGKVEGIYDLRIKGVLDDGIIAQDILFNRKHTEAVCGITLEDAIAMAMDVMDAKVVAEKIQDLLVGHEFTVAGRAMGATLLIESVDECNTPVSEEDIRAFVKEV